MSKVKISLNSSGIRALLKSTEMLKVCEEHASVICKRCGDGYETSPYTGKNRVNVSVNAITHKAKMDNIKNNTVLKALK